MGNYWVLPLLLPLEPVLGEVVAPLLGEVVALPLLLPLEPLDAPELDLLK